VERLIVQNPTSAEGFRETTLEDDHLVAAAAAGDSDAFGKLAVRYREHIYRLAYKVLLNPEDAMDVAQSVLLKLTRAIHSYRGPGRFRAWMSAIAVREALDFLRKPSRHEIAMEPAALDLLRDCPEENPGSDPRSVLEKKDLRDRVREEIQYLSPQQRAIFVLYLGEDLGPKEIAERLGLNPSQVRLQLFRGVGRIQKSLRDWSGQIPGTPKETCS